MSPIIRVQDVTLTYRILVNRSNSIKELFKETLHGRVRIRDFTALTNISFTVERGDVLAIVGRNGAGKSTLLKVLAKVLPPTTGSYTSTGSIAPLIELGAGFHPEMTGSENIEFYSALLGRDLKNIKNRIQHIGEWAGVTSHLDLPLRTYSSGMLARLAFSVATYESADILLVDEVLSVGDAEFRAKSSKRMTDFIAGGAAVVIVSHDLDVIRNLANKVMWLEDGRIKEFGPVEEVLKNYENSFG
jgi:ABC-type polysaccharide/polyol phosphate transport system ATPase subunit